MVLGQQQQLLEVIEVCPLKQFIVSADGIASLAMQRHKYWWLVYAIDA